MERFRRASVTGIAAVALLAGSVGAAMAVASPPPSPAPATAGDTTGKVTTAKDKKIKKKTPGAAGANGESHREQAVAWQQFRVVGMAAHLRPGTKVTLQQRQGKRWMSLPASMNTTRTSAYNMRVMLGLPGHNALRIVGGGTVSPVFHIWVH
jgi:hypothetical protein